MTQLTIGGKTKRSTLGQHLVEGFSREAGRWLYNGKPIPENADDFVDLYGLRQYLADAMAGASDEADAKAKIEARVNKLVTGDLTRTRGEGLDKPDTESTRALKLAKAAIREKAKAANVTLTKEQVVTAAATWVEKNPKWLKEAKSQLAAEAKAKEDVDQAEADAILADFMKDEEEAEAETETE